MRPSLRKIAEISGFGLSTVSRALRGLARVDAQTREKILETARQLGYVRDPALSSAMSFARRLEKPVFREVLGFLSQSSPPNFDNADWLKRLYRGVEERASHLGYGVQCLTIPPASKQRAMQRQLLARGIRGILLTPVIDWMLVNLDFDWNLFSAMELGHVLKDAILPCVERDCIEDYHMMFERLYARGYRRIGLAVSYEDDQRRKGRIIAPYLLFQSQHPDIPALKPLEHMSSCTPEGLSHWMKKVRPDVIITNGAGPLSWVRKQGFRVPEDVGVCRIDCMKNSEEAGLCARYEEMGLTAVNLLAGKLERDEIGLLNSPLVISIPNDWKEGGTLKKISRDSVSISRKKAFSTKPEG